MRTLPENTAIWESSCSFTEMSPRPVRHFGASGFTAILKLLLPAIMAFARLNEPLNLDLKTRKSDPGRQIEPLRVLYRFLGEGSSEISRLFLALGRMYKLSV